MMQYDHIYEAVCIIINLEVMFWKLYTRIYFNVVTFNCFYMILSIVRTLRYVFTLFLGYIIY